MLDKQLIVQLHAPDFLDSLSTAEEVDAVLNPVLADLAEVTALARSIEDSITPQTRRESYRAGEERKNKYEDLSMLKHDGVQSTRDGYWDARVGARGGQLGILALERIVTKLQKRRADLVWEAGVKWPQPHVYEGKLGKCVINGRDIEPGEVVLLSKQQAKAWEDRFATMMESADIPRETVDG